MNETLAIDGGKPVTENLISFHEPPLGQDEIDRAAESIESKWVAGPGPFCEKVESKLEEEWKVPRVLTTTSCTHAMEIALLSLSLDETDEVIVPSFTYVSTALAVLRAGAKPVFADIDRKLWTITPETIDQAKTESTRAVLMVHYGGFPGPVDRVSDYCRNNDLVLVEDAAQCFESSLKGKKAGTFGQFGAISFHGTKSITCGEGGILLVNQKDDVEKCQMIRDKGTDRSKKLRGDVDRYSWRSIGSSYVLSDILGAVLWSQVNRWSEIKNSRKKVQTKLREIIRNVDTKKHFDIFEAPSNATENGHVTAFTVDETINRDWFLEALQAEGVQAREHYHSLHLSPFAQENLEPRGQLPASEWLSESIIRLPTHTELNEKTIGQIKSALHKIYENAIR